MATTMKWTLSIQDDLFALQHPEDGSEYTASVFYIVDTASNGRQFAHDHQFKSAHVFSKMEEGGWFCGIASYREEALAKAEALLARMQAGRDAGKFTSPIGRAHWNEIQPVYGSEAYIRAEPEIVAAEKAAEFDLF